MTNPLDNDLKKLNNKITSYVTTNNLNQTLFDPFRFAPKKFRGIAQPLIDTSIDNEVKLYNIYNKTHNLNNNFNVNIGIDYNHSYNLETTIYKFVITNLKYNYKLPEINIKIENLNNHNDIIKNNIKKKINFFKKKKGISHTKFKKQDHFNKYDLTIKGYIQLNKLIDNLNLTKYIKIYNLKNS